MNLDVVIFQATYRTRAVSWELIYNLITTRNIFVNYEHIILFIKRSILTSLSEDEMHRGHALFKMIFAQAHIWQVMDIERCYEQH